MIATLPPGLDRYWVLLTYTLMAAMQGMTWAVPGSIGNTYSSPSVYNLDGNTIQLFLNYGPIFYVICAFPVMWHMDRYGIRGSVVSAIALVAASNIMRCFANDGSLRSLILLHLSFILNASAGPAAMGVPSKLAEDWFPPSERTAACAVAALGNQSGTLVLSLAIAAVWPNPSVKDNLSLNLFLAALSLANAGAALVYFPSHPPTPPSASASLSKGGEGAITLASLMASIRVMFSNRSYCVVMATYASSTGILNCVNALLPQALGNLGEANPQGLAGWVSFACNASSMVMGISLAYVTDRYKEVFAGAQKFMLIGCMVVSGVTFLAFAFLLSPIPGVLPGWCIWLVAGLYVVYGTGQGIGIPLMFEVCAEQTGVSLESQGEEGEEGGEGEGNTTDKEESLNALLGPGERGGGEEGGGRTPPKEAVPTGTMLMVLTVASNVVSFITLVMPNSTFFLWANWAGAGVFLFSALSFYFLLPATLPRFQFDRVKAAQGKREGEIRMAH